MAHEPMAYDVVIVGAGPAGLSAAIRYALLCRQADQQPSVCVLEKGSEVGAHILSGAVFEPRTLNELLPDWEQVKTPSSAPLETKVKKDVFLLCTATKAYHLPIPPPLRNHGNYIISLGQLCRWLAHIAQNLGVELYPGFAATRILYNEHSTVLGVATGDMGRDRTGQPKANFQPGIEILAKQTLFAEGCRGSLSQKLIARFNLARNCQPQTYGIGLKEIWEVNSAHHQPGTVVHTVGWPLNSDTYGGGFIYHWGNNLVSIGLIIGLDYKNPYLNPYEEFQRFKHHPSILPLLQGGRCLSYGARALNEGGWQSIPTLTFPGGMLIGCSAGFMNVAKIKGSHTAMKSGMLAAETVFEALQSQQTLTTLSTFEEKIKKSWIFQELYLARNIRPAFRYGLWAGLAYGALDLYLLRGSALWTFKHQADHLCTKPAKQCQPIHYTKPDGIISFDKMTSLTRSNVYHEENQIVHLVIADPTIPIKINWQQYAGLEERYCPAGVYEFVGETSQKKLQINAQNCIHCKTCDIKDPLQNITWIPPEGGGGPNYSQM